MRRLLVNDCLTCIPGTRTFWHDLMEWFGCEFVGGDYSELSSKVQGAINSFNGDVGLIIRNATWFPPIRTDVPTISLLQDIIPEGPQREMQEAVIKGSSAIVFNSAFTASRYTHQSEVPLSPLAVAYREMSSCVIPLPVDFTLFEPQNAMGCQQALSLPDGCVCWIGASQGAAGQVKGWDIFLSVVRANPDIPFVAVFKDAAPDSYPPNMRVFVKLTHQELVKVIGACRVGLCTSRMESQHLAGIEMGACGLPLVAPPVGVYWNRNDLPGIVITEPTINTLTAGVRGMVVAMDRRAEIRDYWRTEFDKPVVGAAWGKLVQEVECSGRS